MASDFFYPPSKNAVQKTLSAQLLSTATTGDAITFADVDGLQNKPGVLVINRVDSNGTATPSSREYISYSGTSGNTVLIETRNVDNSASAKTHAVGSIVEFVADAVWAQRLIDQFNIEHDIDGTHDKATAADIVAGTSDAKVITPLSLTYATTSTGWINPNETWTYASATTITVPAGAAAKYAVGDRIKLTQTTVKYFYVVSIADTVLTVTGGSDYTVANAAITANYYSHAASPVGFPVAFNYTPVFTGFSADPTNNVFRFSLYGRVCTVSARSGSNGTSNANSFTITLPIAAATITNQVWASSQCLAIDNSATSTTQDSAIIGSGSTTMALQKASNQAGWTTSGGKRATFSITYEI